MNEKDLEEFEFARERAVSIADRPKSEDVFAVCLESDDETLLVPMKLYKIGLRGDNVRVIDEKGEVAIYPQNFFIVLPLPNDAAAKIEAHRQMDSKLAEVILA